MCQKYFISIYDQYANCFNFVNFLTGSKKHYDSK